MPKVKLPVTPVEQTAEQTTVTESATVLRQLIELNSYDRLIELDPYDIWDDPLSLVRPAPVVDGAEENRISALADSMREVGQITPIRVQRVHGSGGSESGGYSIIAGHRRVEAAKLIPGFKLQAVVDSGRDEFAVRKAAIHENTKRRGYTPLQLALLIQETRQLNGWQGSDKTRTVSNYFGVSPATITQHEKLLTKPTGMSDGDFAEIRERVHTGRITADTAFAVLTDVEPAKAVEILDIAAEEQVLEEKTKQSAQSAIAQKRAPAKQKNSGPLSTGKEKQTNGGTNPPQETASQSDGGKVESKATEKKAAVKVEKPKPVSKKKLLEVAKEHKALTQVAETKSWSKQHIVKFFEEVIGPAYPKVLSNLAQGFVDAINGKLSEEKLLAKWTQVAMLLEERTDIDSQQTAVPETVQPNKAARVVRRSK